MVYNKNPKGGKHMKINFNVTGELRKDLVKAISSFTGQKAVYKGAPSFAYKIGGMEVSKDGTLTASGSVTDKYNTELLKALNADGFIGEVANRGDSKNEAYPDIDQHHPCQYADPNAPVTEEMMKQAEAWLEGQPKSRTYQAELSDPDCPDRMEVFGAEDDEDAIRQAYEYAVGEVVLLELFELDEKYNVIRSVELTPRRDRLTIEVPLDGFTPEKLENLTKLVAAKTPLLKAALGADKLSIKQTAETLQFPWFSAEHDLTNDEVEAYSTLISLICKTVLEKKRVTAKEKATDDNPKYAMRCFLLSLGFIGSEFKNSRRVLLSKLEGNTAWKNGKQAEATEDEIPE